MNLAVISRDQCVLDPRDECNVTIQLESSGKLVTFDLLSHKRHPLAYCLFHGDAPVASFWISSKSLQFENLLYNEAWFGQNDLDTVTRYYTPESLKQFSKALISRYF